MDTRKMSSGRVALALLALAAVFSLAVAGVAAGAGQERTDASQNAREVVVSPPQSNTSNTAAVDCPGSGLGGDDPGAVDGDPNVPLNHSDHNLYVALLRAMVILSALGI